MASHLILVPNQNDKLNVESLIKYELSKTFNLENPYKIIRRVKQLSGI